MFESLRSLSDNQVLSSTDSIVIEDRKLTLRLLLHLHEIERRKLYAKRGYASMFVYCTKHLKLSEPAAVRRIKTARCLVRFPELCSFLESGEVNLTTVSMIARILRPENKHTLLARIRGKSRREVEAVVAEYEPRAALPPDTVRTVVVPVPRAASAGQIFTVASDGGKSSTVDGSTPDCDVQESRSATVAPVLERRALIQFTAGEEFMDLVERVRSIASHRLKPNATFEQVFALALSEYVKREDPIERHERREVKKGVAIVAKVSAKSPRNIPAHVRDHVFARDKGRCTFTGTTGTRCDSTRHLQIDHIIPVARGGSATIDNLRLLCAKHNRLEAERLIGCSASSLRTNI